MKKTLLIVLPFIVLSAVALSWWLFYHERQPVRLTEVRLMDIHVSINTNGVIEAERVFEVRPQVAGICRRLLVREGAVMKQGQPILEIESESIRAELTAARAELDAAELDLRNIDRGPTAEEFNQAQAEVSRARLDVAHAGSTLTTNEWLLQRNAITAYDVELSRHELARAQQALNAALTRTEDLKTRFGKVDRKRAESRIAAAQARMDYLEMTLAKSVLRAPADGTLFQFALKDGAYLNTGELVGLMADLSRLQLKAFVDEPDLGKVSPGAEVLISWNAHPGQRWKATVGHIPSQVVPRGSRSVAEVLCRIENPILDLLPSIHVDVEILMGKEPPVAALSRDAVFSEGRNQYVWAPRGDVATKVIVQTGRSTSSLVEITKGLSLGDKVIVPDQFPITEGMQLRIIE